LLHSLGQRNRERARPDLFRPFAMHGLTIKKGVGVHLIIRPDDGTNQISMGADFGSLKTYQRCSPSEPATRR
jgi:hypothetical protein